ncbi:hypothetical protein [Salinarimonas rosea]|uniref:hypothetical protein n=1 Tax=Salinarimonas rosea TaxID=552063 RepID=UPI000417D621|nr:hypothetical protein [Salinarimonas rosea]
MPAPDAFLAHMDKMRDLQSIRDAETMTSTVVDATPAADPAAAIYAAVDRMREFERQFAEAEIGLVVAQLVEVARERGLDPDRLEVAMVGPAVAGLRDVETRKLVVRRCVPLTRSESAGLDALVPSVMRIPPYRMGS